jgi:hypothetical protein
MTVTQVRPALRCGDIQVWPLYVAPPRPPWPRPWPDDRPPRWWIWWRLYEIQAGRCAACGVYPPHCIDHDHTTGLVRGLLCRWCNSNESVAARGQRDCPHEPRCYRLYWDNPPAGGYRWLYPGPR